MTRPDFALLARHNVRVVASSDGWPDRLAHPVSTLTDSDAFTTVTLVAERVPAALAHDVARRVEQEKGTARVGPPDGETTTALRLHLTAAALARVIAAKGVWPAGLAAAIEHAWQSYRVRQTDRRPTRIMGVVNVTPDSFNPVGRCPDPAAAVEHALCLAEEGADVLDVGGESTRPGAEPVPADEELRRVLPVVRRLSRETRVPVSVDTTKAEVAARCLDEGARWINDISGLTFDSALAGVAARAGATLVLMHIRGTPRTMQQAPVYADVVADTLRWLRERVAVAVAAGVPFENLVLDPGFGFGKTVAHNLEILRRLREYTSAGAPILIGTSRKSTIGHVLGGLPPEERLEGTAATVVAAILNGASLVRVHDVRAMRRVAQMTDAILWGQPG